MFWKGLVIFAVTICGCSGNPAPGTHNDFHPYGVSHAILHFEYLGSVRGTSDLFIDSFGRYEAHDEHSELIDSAGFRPNHVYSIRRGAFMSVVDSERRLVTRFVDPTIDSLYQLPAGSVPDPQQQASAGLTKSLYRPVGDTLVHGLSASLFKEGVYHGYIYLWKGIVIGRAIAEGGHPNEMKLISIDTVTPIDPSRFLPPADFQVRQMPPPGSAPQRQ